MRFEKVLNTKPLQTRGVYPKQTSLWIWECLSWWNLFADFSRRERQQNISWKSTALGLCGSESTLRLRWAKSPIASAQRMYSTLAGHSADPRRTNVTRMNANRMTQIAATMQGLLGRFWCRERCDRQRALVIRTAAISLASDSLITIAQFRPSKHCNGLSRCFEWMLLVVRGAPSRTTDTTFCKFTTSSEFVSTLWFTIAPHTERMPFPWIWQAFAFSSLRKHRNQSIGKWRGVVKNTYSVVIH